MITKHLTVVREKDHDPWPSHSLALLPELRHQPVELIVQVIDEAEVASQRPMQGFSR
jgi:hypothetical protein